MPLPLKNKGFSLAELLVAIAITGTLLLIVLPNFHKGKQSNELDVGLKQFLEDVKTIRNLSLGGQIMTNGSFPDGYGLGFNLAEPGQYQLFAALASGKEILPNGGKEFAGFRLISLWGLKSLAVVVPPGPGEWENIGASLDIIFFPEKATAGPAQNPTGDIFRFVGGVIEHEITGQQAYFYVSLPAGQLLSGLF